MKLLRSFPVMAFTLVLLSIAAYCTAEQSVTLLVVAGTLAALSWYVTEGPRGRTLPRWASSGLVIAVALGSGADFMLHPADLPGVLGRFSIGLTLVKLYDRRSARDHAHLLGLSLLLILVGCLSSQELLFGVFVLLFAGLGLYVLMLFQLYAAHERVTLTRRRGPLARAEAANGHAPPSVVAPTIGRHVGLQFRGLVTAIALGSLLLSAVLFVTFPRSIGSVRPGRRVVGGQVEEINLASGTRITQSRRAAFRMRVTDSEGRPLALTEPLLLRGAVLDDYDAGSWTASGAATVDRSAPGWIVPTPTASDPIVLDLEFTMPVQTLLSPYLPVAFETSRPRRLVLRPDVQTVRTTPGLWAYTVMAQQDPSNALVTELASGASPVSGGRPYTRTTRASEVDEVRKLAHTVLENAGLPLSPRGDRWAWNLAAAQAFVDHLRGGGFVYTLDLSDVVRRGWDPVAEFLLRTRRGHCEFFASSLAALCHTVGIDARVAIGYVVAGEGTDGRYLVLESAAHAWVEVRAGPVVYRAFDPTPPSVLARAAGPTRP